MNADVEQLLREGLDRLAAAAEVPAGLVGRARRHRRRRRLAAGCVAAVASAAVTAVAVGAAAGRGAQPGVVTRAQTTAYVLRHVEAALAGETLVIRGQSAETSRFRGRAIPAGTITTWVYGPLSRSDLYSGSNCGHVLPNGWCTYHGRSEIYAVAGTALIGGRFWDVYVTPPDRRWSGGPIRGNGRVPANACRTDSGLAMGGGLMPTGNWPEFIKATLACGAATVTGHARIDGVETTVITGSPVTDRLSKGYSRLVKATSARVVYTLYVNPATYLPVRISATTYTYGRQGKEASNFTVVTDVRWLPPTAANVAHALVTIPPGFRHVTSVANQ